MAPEILSNQHYNFSSDFYSIGALLYELLTGYPPYYHEKVDTEEEKVEIMNNMSLLKLSQVTENPSLKELLRNLLHPDPNKRICNFQEIKNSIWLNDINWKDIESKHGGKSEQMKFAPELYQTYICKEFLDLEDEVEGMNLYEEETFQCDIEEAFFYIKN